MISYDGEKVVSGSHYSLITNNSEKLDVNDTALWLEHNTKYEIS